MKLKKQIPYNPSKMSFSCKRVLVAMRNRLRQGCYELSDLEKKLPPKVRKTLYLILLIMGLVGNGLLAFHSLSG